jgi:protein SCO1/2
VIVTGSMDPIFRFALQILLGLFVGGLAGCSGDNTERERVFHVKGVVRAPYADGTISIQHDEIPDFMPAMTMPFYTDEDEAKDLSVGDHIEFEFHVGERSRATKFRRMQQAGAIAESRAAPTSDAARASRRLREGDEVPAFSLIDQAGRPLTEADLRHRPTVVTFVFTRCPVPEFCPLIARKFQELQKSLLAEQSGAAAKAQLLSVSIDPEHDRPEVLRQYGMSLGANFNRWRFATGTNEEVENLTRLFAVHTEAEGGVLNHTLATALIGPDGKLVEIWRGNAWKPEQILTRLNGI